MGATGKNRWKISFHRSSFSSSSPKTQTAPKKPPPEFICPISSSLMSDPVIVASGQTFERSYIKACLDLSFVPPFLELFDLSSSLVPNIALRSTILGWCDAQGIERPKPPDPSVAMDFVRSLMPQKENDSSKKTPARLSQTAMEVSRRPKHLHSSSEESVSTTPPLPLATKPSFSSSSSSSSTSSSPSSSSEIAISAVGSAQEEEIVRKLKSVLIFEQEEAVIWLRTISRNNPEQRIPLCTPRLLSAIRPSLLSRYPTVQINSTAAIVNLSLEKPNKERIMRSGAVPALIDVLKGGFSEAQEHAAGAIFSLALEDNNKPAIGLLGAVEPLLHTLRHERHLARKDSAMALYHLSLLQCNRTKLVKLGAVPMLLGFAKGGELAARSIMILSNLAASADGRAALLDSHAVKVFVEMLRENTVSEEMKEHCIAVLYALSSTGSVLRFKGSAIAAGAVEALKEQAERGKSERGREKARRMLAMLKGKAAVVDGFEGGEDRIEEEERVSDSIVMFRQQLKEKIVSSANSTEF